MTAIIVRHSTIEDVSAIKKVLSGPLAVAGTLQLPHLAESVIRERLAKPAPGNYSLVAESSGQVVGTLTLSAMQNVRRRHVATLGMAVKDNHAGQGIGSALLGEAIDLAENWLSISRIELTAFTDNESAIALYKKFNFSIEGKAVNFAFRDGEYVDAIYMARISKGK